MPATTAALHTQHHARAAHYCTHPPTARRCAAQARASYRSAQQAAGHVYEAFYNGGLAAFRAGEFQEAYEMVGKALAACPDHTESLELSRQLANTFALL